MNNFLSYCGLVDERISAFESASEKDLPVIMSVYLSIIFCSIAMAKNKILNRLSTFISTGGPGSWKDFTKSVPIVSWHEMIHFFSINPDHWYDQIFQWHHFGGHEIS